MEHGVLEKIQELNHFRGIDDFERKMDLLICTAVGNHSVNYLLDSFMYLVMNSGDL